jgi:hypothetical protein
MGHEMAVYAEAERALATIRADLAVDIKIGLANKT